MGAMKYFDEMIESKLLDMHTAYLATVLSVSGNKATVQPLGMYKEYGENAKKQAIVSNITVVKSAQNKISKQEIKIDGKAYNLAVLTPLSAGDTVICVCCDRDISQAQRGINSVPTIGHHNISDSIIVGVL